jgi:FixJ family two-component response regulator
MLRSVIPASRGNAGGLSLASVGIVEDDKAVREALRFSLEREGFVVNTYDSAAAFLGDGDAMLLGVLVVDQQMPGMTGIELVTALRSRRCLIPSILITTWPDDGLRKRALQAGCLAVLEKPLTGNALFDCIHAAVDETRSV